MEMTIWNEGHSDGLTKKYEISIFEVRISDSLNLS